jgi:hypothetical protein
MFFLQCKFTYISYIYTHSVWMSILRQVHSLFQTKFSTECQLVFPSFDFQYHVFFQGQSSFLRLLPRIPVTYLHPSIFPSMTCFRMQILRKMWPIHLALFVVCRIFLSSLILFNPSSFLTRSVQMISILLQHHISLPTEYCEKFIAITRVQFLLSFPDGLRRCIGTRFYNELWDLRFSFRWSRSLQRCDAVWLG